MEDYPSKLRNIPIPLVLLLGSSEEFLRTIEKQPFASTCESTQNPRTIRFLSASYEKYVAPIRKYKDKSSDSSPRSILTFKWIKKMTSDIPSVIIFLIEWDSSSFNTKHVEYLGAIELLRNSVKSYNIQLLVLLKGELIQLNDEKFINFRRRAAIDSRSFIHFHTSNMVDSMNAFEEAVTKAIQDHYSEEIKYYKRLKKRQLKFNVKYIIRYCFKIAFCSEIRGDYQSAIKYYSSAFSKLRLIRISWKDFDEIRNFAEILNFKICYLDLYCVMFNAAFYQFSFFINYYRILVGDPKREFQQMAWISRQYKIFGQLLQVFNMDPTTRSQNFHSNGHPGYYFQAAVNYQCYRRESAYRLCGPELNTTIIIKLSKYVKPYNPLYIDVDGNDYIGVNVNPYSPLSSEYFNRVEEVPDDILGYLNDVHAVAISQESLTDYSNLIIELLNNALSSYTSLSDHFKVDRMIMYIRAQIGHEYFILNKFKEVHENYSGIIPHYKRENWWKMLTPILLEDLLASENVEDWISFFRHLVDLMNPKVNLDISDKQSYWFKLVSIIHDGSESVLKSSLEFDQDLEPNENLGCEVEFSSPTVTINSQAIFRVVLTSNFSIPVRFSRLKVEFSDNDYDQSMDDPDYWNIAELSPDEIESLSKKSNNLLLVPRESKKIEFPMTFGRLGDMSCVCIVLELGGERASLKFKWSKFKGKFEIFKSKKSFNNTKIKVLGYKPDLEFKIEHEPPALIGELYSVGISVENRKDPIISGTISVYRLFGGEDQSTNEENLTFSSKTPRESDNIFKHEIGNIQAYCRMERVIFVLNPLKNDENLVAKLEYCTETYDACIVENFVIPVKFPISVSYGVFDSIFKPISMISYNALRPDSNTEINKTEPRNETTTPFFDDAISKYDSEDTRTSEINENRFEYSNINQKQLGVAILKCNTKYFLLVDLFNVSPFSLRLHGIEIRSYLGVEVSVIDRLSGDARCLVDDVVLEKNHVYSVWFTIVVQKEVSLSPIGEFVVEWSRQRHMLVEEPQKTQTCIYTPCVSSFNSPVEVKIECESSGVVGKKLPYKIFIFNVSEYMVSLTMKVIENSGFTMVGDSSGTFSLNPKSKLVINNTIIPLKSGIQICPNIVLQNVSRQYCKLEKSKTELNRMQNNLEFSSPNIYIESHPNLPFFI